MEDLVADAIDHRLDRLLDRLATLARAVLQFGELPRGEVEAHVADVQRGEALDGEDEGDRDLRVADTDGLFEARALGRREDERAVDDRLVLLAEAAVGE